MAVDHFTYQQLDQVLSQLGFTRRTATARDRTWFYYEHPETETEIIVVEKKPTEMVSVTAALSARRQLIEKGLVNEEQLDRMLTSKKEHAAPT